MRKLAILALVYLFCLEPAYADSKKDIELEYLKSIAGTSKECFNLNSKTINYKKIINNFEKTFEQNLKNNSVNLNELSSLYFCYVELQKKSQYLNIVDRLMRSGLIDNQKYLIPKELFEYYGLAFGEEILKDDYQKNISPYYNRIDNLIKMGQFLINQNYNEELLNILIYSQVDYLYLDKIYQDKYLQFLNNSLQHFKNLKNNISVLQVTHVKLKFLSNNLQANCAVFFNTDVKPLLKVFDGPDSLKFLIDKKLYQIVNSIYSVANICISSVDIKKSFYHTIEHIELMEYFRDSIKEVDFNKKISDEILDKLLYLHQVSGASGFAQPKKYENSIKEKLSIYASTRLKKMDVEIDLIKQIWAYRDVDTKEEKEFIKKINDGINFLNTFNYEDYKKEEDDFPEFTRKIFQKNLDDVKFKYMDLYSVLLFAFGKYSESILTLEKQIQFLELEKNKYSKKSFLDSHDFTSTLPGLYLRLLNAKTTLKDWKGAEKTFEKGLLHCNLLPLENYDCYAFKSIYLKEANISKKKEGIVKAIDDINFFYNHFVNNINYKLYTQDKKDRFKKEYLTHKTYGLYHLLNLKEERINFKDGAHNVKNYMCDSAEKLKKLVNTSSNKEVNSTKNILGALAITNSGYCNENKLPVIDDEFFNLAQKLINEYKSYINLDQYSDFLQKTDSKDVLPLSILEMLSQNKNHPKYQKTSREIFMILQSEEAKFYFKSKNNLINKKYPGLVEKINKQNALQLQYENLLAKMYNQENIILDTEFANKKKLIEEKITFLKNEINKNFPTFNKFNFKKTFSVSDIQKRLGKDDALIYLKNSMSATAIVITKKDFQVNANTNIGNLKGNIFQKFKVDLKKNLLKSLNNKKNSVAINSTKVFGALIYQQFLKQVEPYINDKKNLYFITDEYMSDIPFELLVVNKEVYKEDAETLLKEGFEAEYLIEKFNIKYLPNTASLMELKKNKATQSEKANLNFLGVGNPKFSKSNKNLTSLIIDLNSRGFLKDVDKINSNYEELPFTGKELSTLKNIFKKSTVLEYTAATETNVKSLDLKKFNIINFATHAEVSSAFQGFNEPFLVLTPPKISSEMDDGLLTSSEVSGLNLNANLVILSACDTSAKKNQYASGFSGLISSFLLAGANSVVATHWPVDDNAGYLLMTETMKKFVHSDLDFSEALRKTKIEFIKGKFEGKFKNPFFWAPYVYVGI